MIRISLGKAHKLLQTLKKSLKTSGGKPMARPRRLFWEEEETGPGVGAFDVSVPRRGMLGVQIAESVRNKADHLRQAFERHLDLQEDMGLLKEAIFRANQTSGASAALQRQSFLRYRLGMLERLLQEIRSAPVGAVAPEQVNGDLIASLRGGGEGGDDNKAISLSILLYSPEELESEMREIRIEINRIDEKIREINATTLVEVELRELTRELLGLE